MSFRIRYLELPHRLILAPMCSITTLPFRRLVKDFGAGLVFNQMVSAKAVVMQSPKTFKLLRFLPEERPIGMQLFGKDPATLAEAAKIVEALGCDLIDLNLGCPARKIVNDGGGSALLGDPKAVARILEQMRKAIAGIFTIKIRAGWDEKTINALDIAKMAQDLGIDAITIHARTRSQGYKGKANWGMIADIKSQLKIPVIGNGDVIVASDAMRMLSETGCDAVMTGRGAWHQPWIFRNFIENHDNVPNTGQLKMMILKHYAYAFEEYGNDAMKLMRKFVCAYTKGMPNGSALRNAIVRLDEWEEIKNQLDTFFRNASV